MSVGTHYIIIDRTDLDCDAYSVTVGDGNVTIKGSHDTIDYAISYFANRYLFERTRSSSYNLTSADNVSNTVNQKTVYSKTQLLDVLTTVYTDNNSCIIGEEAMPYVNNAIKRFNTATGENPGLIGIDLTPYGMDIANLSRENLSMAVCQILDYCSEGGIVCVSSHFTNPSGCILEGDYQHCRGTLGDYESVAEYENAFEQLLTPGTAYNTAFQSELALYGEFLSALKENGIPVLYRPLHEMNGNWFWWCIGQKNYIVDSSYIKRLWAYIHDYFTIELGLDNLLWVYAPDITNDSVSNYIADSMLCYPGDKYVDIGGSDWYTSGKNKLEIKDNDSYLNVVNQTEKICAITEFGPRFGASADWLKTNYPDYYSSDLTQMDVYNSMDLYEDLMQLKYKGYKFAYLMTWINKWSIPYMGRGDEFMATDYTLGQDEVADLFSMLNIIETVNENSVNLPIYID